MNQKTEFDICILGGQTSGEYFKDLFRFRELFYFFAWRDILVRYKQAFFGVAWAIARPVLTMILFSFLFGKIARLPSDQVDYSLFVLAGMLPWQLFANVLTDTCICLLNNAHLISKVYFPRVIIPSSQIMVHVVDFSVGVFLLVALSVYMNALNPLSFLLFPLFFLWTVLLCLGGGLWLSALTVKYRDFRFLIPFVVQFGMFISPVGYGSFVIPSQWKWLYFLNPMVGVIDGFRWTFFGVSYPHFFFSLAFSLVITIVLLITGFFYFRKTERTLADQI